MRTTKKILASVLAVCMLASTSFVTAFAANSDDAEVGANNYNLANQAVDANYTYDGGDLGANYSPEQTVFKLWSPKATKVVLNRFTKGSDNEPGAENLGSVEMEKLMDGDRWTGVWTTTVTGDIVNTYYTYTVTSTLIDKNGKALATPQVAETQDVYSVATGVNGRRSMVCDLSSTNPDGWDNDTHVLLDKQTENQVWEVHVKDFTWDQGSGIKNEDYRGKFMGFTETGTTLNNEGNVSTCIDYLKQLGVTTVQINPFYDFQSIDEAGSNDQFNWGYDPQNYNVPEGSYSTNPYDGNVRIQECKAMIKALHDAGISVVMDVVYNHTFSCDANDSCFQATVPYYYHRMRTTGAFSNGSGCGNEVATEFAMTRQYIRDSCKYWVNEYHVDGFRFDLMGLMDVECMNQIREDLDRIDSRLYMWGEGWTGGTSYHDTKTYTGAKFYAATQANAGMVNDRVAFFSDQIRNGIKGTVFDINEKGYIAGNTSYAKAIRYGVRANTYKPANATDWGWTSTAPSQTVTYAACHDNATLYDQISASTGKKYGVRDADSVKKSKMASAILNTSQGVTFYLAGDEMARTKYGDTNSYKSSPEINKITWNNAVDYADLVGYYSGMMKIKANYTPLTSMDKSFEDNFKFFNTTPSLDVNSDNVQFEITNNTEGEWKTMLVIHNAAATDKTFTVNGASADEWVIIANDRCAGVDNLGEVQGKTFEVPAYSSMIAVDKESFDAADIPSDTGKVIVNYKYGSADGAEVAPSTTVTGKIGAGYQVLPTSGVDPKYEFDSVIGEDTGVFSEEAQEVTFIYTDYIPEPLRTNGDLDGDGEISALDVTMMQKILVEKAPMPNKDLDFNCDGQVDIMDTLMMQKFTAGHNVATGSVQINYYYTDPQGQVKQFKDSTIDINGRVGEEFTSEPYVVMGYSLDETRLPQKTSGTIEYGPKLVVNYYYVPGNCDVNLHFKHSGNLTWDPYLWIWASDLEGKHLADQNFTGGTWAGKPALDDDGDGWYDYSFVYENVKDHSQLAGTYNIIVSASSSGTNQTKDYEGFGYNEMWVVIDDSLVGSSNDYLKFYLENPDENPGAKPIN